MRSEIKIIHRCSQYIVFRFSVRKIKCACQVRVLLHGKGKNMWITEINPLVFHIDLQRAYLRLLYNRNYTTPAPLAHKRHFRIKDYLSFLNTVGRRNLDTMRYKQQLWNSHQSSLQSGFHIRGLHLPIYANIVTTLNGTHVYSCWLGNQLFTRSLEKISPHEPPILRRHYMNRSIVFGEHPVY